MTPRWTFLFHFRMKSSIRVFNDILIHCLASCSSKSQMIRPFHIYKNLRNAVENFNYIYQMFMIFPDNEDHTTLNIVWPHEQWKLNSFLTKSPPYLERVIRYENIVRTNNFFDTRTVIRSQTVVLDTSSENLQPSVRRISFSPDISLGDASFQI